MFVSRSRTLYTCAIILSSLAFLLVLHPVLAHAQYCPAGTVPIGDRAAATAAGIPTSAQCWNPNDPNVGQQAGSAKEWLKQHATRDTNISCMNAQFAEKLKKMMEAVPGGVPTIVSGY